MNVKKGALTMTEVNILADVAPNRWQLRLYLVSHRVQVLTWRRRLTALLGKEKKKTEDGARICVNPNPLYSVHIKTHPFMRSMYKYLNIHRDVVVR